MDRIGDDHALGRNARLASVGETTPKNSTGRRLEVGVFEHDRRVAAAELEGVSNKARRAGERDCAPGGDASRKEKLVDRCVRKRGAGRAVAGKHLHHILWYSALVKQLSEANRGRGRQLGWLEDDGVSGDER